MYPVKKTTSGHGLGQVNLTTTIIVPKDSKLLVHHVGERFSVDSRWEGEPPKMIATATPGPGPFGPIQEGKTIYRKVKVSGERHPGAEAEDARGSRFAGSGI
jgi:hypothetical protein